MDKKKKLRSKKIAGIRGWIQAAATLLTNPHIPNFFQGKIYQGKAKTVCVPGLNCYSCPAATGACPIGAFQAVVGSSKFKFSYYITGFLILLGVTLGRFICGFLCPFGWFQDLLHKIPGKKFSTARLKPLRYLKYIILVVFVILLPMFATNSIGMGDPFFCKYICPQGVLEGAIPLSIGYATLLHMDQGVALGRVLPMVMLGGLTAIIISGCLNQLGKRYPHLTGEGQLMPNRANADATVSQPAFSGKADVTTIASGALLAVLLYMLGMLGHKLIGLPAPVGMLFMAVLVKLCNGASPRLLEGSQVVYKFFQTSVTYPILFAVGVAITPWHELVAAFTLTNLLVIISTVSALVATGFFVGKKIGMHPIDVAIVSCCQSGQGGTGDVAILTAGNRMSLMPFAQIATRIGGAINVSISLLILGNFLV